MGCFVSAPIERYPLEHRGRVRVEVDKVIDGDTIAVYLPNRPYRLRVLIRFRGINAPELRQPGGPEAKAFVETFVKPGRSVVIQTYKWDKYGGRVVGDVFIRNKALSTSLVCAGHAQAVDYGRRRRPRV